MSYALLVHRVLRLRLPTNRRRLERQMTRTVAVVTVAFVVCHLPFYVTHQISLRQRQRVQEMGAAFNVTVGEATIFAYLNALSHMLVFIGSCCNPIIYGLSNRNYRKSSAVQKQQQKLFASPTVNHADTKAPIQLHIYSNTHV